MGQRNCSEILAAIAFYFFFQITDKNGGNTFLKQKHINEFLHALYCIDENIMNFLWVTYDEYICYDETLSLYGNFFIKRAGGDPDLFFKGEDKKTKKLMYRKPGFNR